MPSSYNHFSLIVSSTINLIAMLFLCVLVSGYLKLVVTNQFISFFAFRTGLNHQVVSRGSLAISLPSIHFHSDAEEQPTGEEEIGGPKR